MKTKLVIVAALAATAVQAEFKIDRSVMSEEYWKIWNDDVQAKIDADIEKYRKADASVEVAAPDGTEVHVEQISHAFFFGAHIFNFNQLGKKEYNDRYKELYGTLFNSATVAFYWKTLEPYQGQVRFQEDYRDTERFWNDCKEPWLEPHWRRPATDPVISFLKTRGLRIHGHPLCWGNNAWQTPSWIWDEFCPKSEKEALENASEPSGPVIWTRTNVKQSRSSNSPYVTKSSPTALTLLERRVLSVNRMCRAGEHVTLIFPSSIYRSWICGPVEA